MTRFIKALAVLSFLGGAGNQAWADADYTVINELLGTYPIVARNNSFTVAGTAEIFANEGGVGYRLNTLKMSTNPVPDLTLMSPKQSTVLKKTADGISQVFQNGPNQIRIDYLLYDGYLVLDSTRCNAHSCVANDSITLSSGKSPGELVPAKDFLGKIRGNYAITLVGGAPPHPESNTGDVSATEDPEQDQMRMPYCQPKGCDPGYLDMPYAGTRVYLNQGVYTILQGALPKLRHYTWVEDAQGTVTLSNYQYRLLTKEVVTLEHLLKRNTD